MSPHSGQEEELALNRTRNTSLIVTIGRKEIFGAIIGLVVKVNNMNKIHKIVLVTQPLSLNKG